LETGAPREIGPQKQVEKEAITLLGVTAFRGSACDYAVNDLPNKFNLQIGKCIALIRRYLGELSSFLYIFLIAAQ
jgi:hypothetical protein